MRRLRFGLFIKFVLIMGALASVPVAILSYQLSGISSRGIEDAVLELHIKLAENLAEQVDGQLSANLEKLALAFNTMRQSSPWKEKESVLKAMLDAHPDIMEISVVNASGKEILKVYNPDWAVAGESGSRAQEAGFRRYLEKGGRTATIDRQNAALIFYEPLSAATLVRVAVSLRDLGARIAAERLGGTGFVVLIDGEGAPLFYPQDLLGESMRQAMPRWEIVQTVLRAPRNDTFEGLTGSKNRFIEPSSGRDYLGAYATVKGLNCSIITLQPRSEAFATVNRMWRTFISVLAIVLVAAIVVATIVARKLTAPLLALTRGAEAVSREDFSARVEVTTGDEIQDFSETFNRMTAKLQGYSDMQVDRLVAEQRKTGAILFSIDEGILMVGRDERILLANRRVLELMGLSLQTSIEGKTLAETVTQQVLREALLASAADPKPGAFREIDMATDKKHLSLRVTTHPILAQGDSAANGLVLAVRDITLEKDLEKMKEEFLHYITHDLRNPLGSAMGFIEVLLKGLVGALNPEQRNMVSSIQRSMGRLMAMINNILDIAKMESGKIRINLHTASLGAVAGRALGILEALALQKKIKMSLDAPEDTNLEIDSDLLERVFTNLLGNAIKYTPNEGSIRIRIVDEGAHLKASVEDSGEGIPTAYLGRIFEKFEQVAGQRKGGTGLGLTITKFFVEAHRGRIWAESDVGKGSRFNITLPKNLVLDVEGNVVIGEKVA